jgi:hypothetical protein
MDTPTEREAERREKNKGDCESHGLKALGIAMTKCISVVM